MQRFAEVAALLHLTTHSDPKFDCEPSMTGEKRMVLFFIYFHLVRPKWNLLERCFKTPKCCLSSQLFRREDVVSS